MLPIWKIIRRHKLFYRKSYVVIGAALSFGLAGCGSEGDEREPTAQEIADVAANVTDAEAPEPPPMVVSSPSYRCDDGNALYVDVLTDENAVNVRDTRQDLPTRLTREDGEGPFTADNRSLSGVGDEVQYSAPDRPNQTCRAAPA